ncbi:MAG: hypothetical protein ACM3JC_16355 [Rudaea sp.]
MDRANTRDLGPIVTDAGTSSPRRNGRPRSRIAPIAHDVPGYQGRYRITKTILADTQRDVLQEIRFEALQGTRGDYAVLAARPARRVARASQRRPRTRTRTFAAAHEAAKRTSARYACPYRAMASSMHVSRCAAGPVMHCRSAAR